VKRKVRVSDLPEFDSAQLLDSEASVVAYLNDIIQAGDAALLVSALGDVARARGLASLVDAASITRHALARARRLGAQPSFETISHLCHALGLKLVFQAAT
jgi:probable addiction module antidote protein